MIIIFEKVFKLFNTNAHLRIFKRKVNRIQ